MYAVVFECKEARAGLPGRPVVTEAGTMALLCVEPEGWVPATGSTFSGGFADAKRFSSEADAHEFMHTWDGHPWYYIPSGKYELIELRPQYEQVVRGWEVVPK
jgi:hypothetical protein